MYVRKEDATWPAITLAVVVALVAMLFTAGHGETVSEFVAAFLDGSTDVMNAGRAVANAIAQEAGTWI